MLTAPIRVAVLCSHRAPGLPHLLRLTRRGGRPWRLACCLTSEQTFAEEPEMRAAGIPVITHPVRWFYETQSPGARLGDLTVRGQYDEVTLALLRLHQPDIVLLAGYLLKLTRPMLDEYARRIINVHHADLLLRNPDGGPRYPGLRAVRDAVLAGEAETRSSAHIVTERLDDGPVLARSRAFPVPDVATWARRHGADDVLKAVIWAQQEWMLREAFGPLMAEALSLTAVLNLEAAS
jgi:folate-dependent phosphoribosylglycinamide formyltransferase PurN